MQDETTAILIAGFISFGMGTLAKIAYDFFVKGKAPEQARTKESNGLYSTRLCELKHQELDKDMELLSANDKRLDTCVFHLKEKVHGIEVVEASHTEQLKANVHRMERIENAITGLHVDAQDIKKGVNDLLRFKNDTS